MTSTLLNTSNTYTIAHKSYEMESAYTTIYNTDLELIYANTKFINKYCYNDVSKKNITDFYTINNNLNKKICGLHQFVLNSNSSYLYILANEFEQNKELFIEQVSPIKDENDKNIGTICISKHITYNNQQEPLINQLTNRQKDILLMLSFGIPQKTIANLLNIERGTVAKTINNICTKLGIYGASEKSLSNMFHATYSLFPTHLLTPQLIKINSWLEIKDTLAEMLIDSYT